MSEYRSLVESFPPRPIRDEEQLSRTWSRIEELLTKPRRSSAEDDYLSLLSDMVEHWEAEHVQMPKLHGVELVRELLDDNQLPQRALVQIFATDSIVSEVLSGKRELQRKHIEGLASFSTFHLRRFSGPPLSLLLWLRQAGATPAVPSGNSWPTRWEPALWCDRRSTAGASG
jgi:HTH-type transcriptional regulator/antitoxin HigA